MAAIRVLLVDDAPAVRMELRALLPLLAEANGLALEIAGEANDGQEALRQVAALRPDVVCLDLDMPETDGLAAAAAIEARWPATWVIAFSAHGDADTAQRARAAGVDELIVKGAALDGLMARLAKWYDDVGREKQTLRRGALSRRRRDLR